MATDDNGVAYFTVGAATDAGTDGGPGAGLYSFSLLDGGPASGQELSTTMVAGVGDVAVPDAGTCAWVGAGSQGLGLVVTSPTGDQSFSGATPSFPTPSTIHLAGGVSRQVFFSADAALYSLSTGLQLGDLGTTPALIAPDTNPPASGYVYYVDVDADAGTALRRIVKTSFLGSPDGWSVPIPAGTTVTGLVATKLPSWIQVTAGAGEILDAGSQDRNGTPAGKRASDQPAAPGGRRRLPLLRGSRPRRAELSRRRLARSAVTTNQNP